VPITNYGHNNQSIGHQWEWFKGIYCYCYHKGRYFADMKITAGTRGLILTLQEIALIMVNIYKDYDEIDLLIRVKVGQGNKTSVL
jgi:hypothetical protein